MTKPQTVKIPAPVLVRTRPGHQALRQPTIAERAAASFEAIRSSTPGPSSEGPELTEQQALTRLAAMRPG
jgi:hypothetical protein